MYVCMYVNKSYRRETAPVRSGVAAERSPDDSEVDVTGEPVHHACRSRHARIEIIRIRDDLTYPGYVVSDVRFQACIPGSIVYTHYYEYTAIKQLINVCMYVRTSQWPPLRSNYWWISRRSCRGLANSLAGRRFHSSRRPRPHRPPYRPEL